MICGALAVEELEVDRSVRLGGRQEMGDKGACRGARVVEMVGPHPIAIAQMAEGGYLSYN